MRFYDVTSWSYVNLDDPKYKKWGPTKWIVREGSEGTPPGNFEILHALKCVMGAPEALFCA